MLQVTESYTKFPLSNKCRGIEFRRIKIVACRPLPNYSVWIRFDDGLEVVVDLSDLVGKGVFSAWESIAYFNQVHINPQTDTLTWGDDIDLDPYVLRERVVKNSSK